MGDGEAAMVEGRGIEPEGRAVPGHGEGGGHSQTRPTAAAGDEAPDPWRHMKDYVLHSDGVVCRCAVVWRREALARGLADRTRQDPSPATEDAGR